MSKKSSKRLKKNKKSLPKIKNPSIKSQSSTIAKTLQLARQYANTEQWQLAEKCYRQILQTQPQNSEALNFYTKLGNVLRESGQFNDAINCFRKVLAANPQDANVYNDLGIVFCYQNQHPNAIECFQQALSLNPNDVNAHYNLGIVFKEQGQFEQAIDCYQKALALKPNYVEAHNNLGMVFYQQSQLTKAIECYQQALVHQPHYAEAHNNLGVVLRNQQKWPEAIHCFQQALTFKPNYAEAYNNLGDTLRKCERLAEAIELLKQAIVLNPNYAKAHYNLGCAYQQQGQLNAAIHCLQTSIALNPSDVEAYNDLGLLLREQKQPHQAIEKFKHALNIKPNYAIAHYNLGNIFQDLLQFDEAIACYQQVIALQADFAEAYNNLGIAYKDQALIPEAIRYFQTALQIKPNYAQAFNNLLLTCHYAIDEEPANLFAKHQHFNEQYALPFMASFQPHHNGRDPQRPLKIGYVSADFRQHSVAYFVESILAHHHPPDFEIVCYYNYLKKDHITQHLQQYVTLWRDCVHLSDAKLAEQIRHDQIDILVDLAGHTGTPRLAVFMRKPAPVQVTYLGYPNTTGLTAIDYRITDRYVEPDERAELLSSETLLRMPASYFCYTPNDNNLNINELPALQNDFITFGSFNNYAKISPTILALWVQVLKTIPNSKLFVKAKSLNDTKTRQTFLNRLAKLGIESERVIIANYLPVTENHLKLYHQIDIGLDTYPYHGATTTCEALWMGIPVVTLVGDKHASRMGISILTTIGLTELIAKTPAEYIQICEKLANNMSYLKTLRAKMRERMQTSPLMDGATFTYHLESAYRNIWKKWCAKTEV